jgi:hypothetical protein
VSDIDTAVVDSLKALDPGRPIREATNAPQQITSLFDYLVGSVQQARRYGEAERFGRLEVDHKLELRRIRTVFIKCLDRTRIATQSCPSH